ncbi:hypothetical protein CPB83DRAFT_349668 [Crepidotus variabilis]|uniref:F-box domain-containing protein n=1 Tax=Crepidotus variabilis TaxID=179855 RepID=A0A9P6EFU1_9AGAR|nr:hypothetical protein CPB83DRAFT_349668 [Crepidotus variabilis]
MTRKFVAQYKSSKNEETTISRREGLNEKKDRWLSLPTELTIAIFLICHAMDSTTHDMHPSRSHSQLPIEFILSSTCRRWRDLALYLPGLWKRFKFNIAGDVGYAPILDPKELHIYEERSGGQLEDVCIDIVETDYQEEYIEFVNEIFEKHSQSLRHFTLIGKGGFSISSHFSYLFPNKSVPNLEYLTLLSSLKGDITDYDHVIENIEPLLFQNGAPKSQYLRCDGVVAGYGFPPTTNLSILQIEDNGYLYCVMSIEALRPLLLLPLLENLSLFIPHLMLEWPTRNTPNFPISMLRLKNIRLCNKHAKFEHLLPLLKAPCLEYVTLKSFSAGTLSKLQKLRSESPNSFPNVHDLILINCKTSTTPQCSTYKSLFPSVRLLTVWPALGSVQLFTMWNSLQRATFNCNKDLRPSLIKRPKPTSTILTLRVPLECLDAWQKTNEKEPSVFFEPPTQLNDEESFLPRHWPQNGLETGGFRVMPYENSFNCSCAVSLKARLKTCLRPLQFIGHFKRPRLLTRVKHRLFT